MAAKLELHQSISSAMASVSPPSATTNHYPFKHYSLSQLRVHIFCIQLRLDFRRWLWQQMAFLRTVNVHHPNL
ncbi:hypothetical protein C5167_003015 [Papaver somniferum]|uniref:Uncharacterized protein n=1 Tax=Papaver somniferum TaxID=3469 RepID=A0A4Y7L306_PAPSO|nr:hypothetical protein C5167_003015 [Papaver somniferum]